jgi:hypothetical protein
VIPAVPPVTATFTFPSVNDARASEPEEPVATTLYSATNQSGRLKESAMAPSAPAVTSTSRLQLLPALSLTRMCTDSAGCHPAPVSVTSSPGA